MKTLKTFPLLALLACGQAIAATDTNRQADHAALRQLRDKAASAINNLDGNALAPCLAREFAFTTVTQSVLTNQAQVQDFFDRTFRSKDALVTGMKTEPTADILTRFIDENTGVCFGSTKDTYTLKSGEMVTMTNRWECDGGEGKWRVEGGHGPRWNRFS